MALITVTQAAARLGVTDRTIRHRIMRGMPATKYGKTWLVEESVLKKFRPEPVGRPSYKAKA